MVLRRGAKPVHPCKKAAAFMAVLFHDKSFHTRNVLGQNGRRAFYPSTREAEFKVSPVDIEISRPARAIERLCLIKKKKKERKRNKCPSEGLHSELLLDGHFISLSHDEEEHLPQSVSQLASPEP